MKAGMVFFFQGQPTYHTSLTGTVALRLTIFLRSPGLESCEILADFLQWLEASVRARFIDIPNRNLLTPFQDVYL